MSTSPICFSCKIPLNPPTAKFCPECGTKLSRPQQDPAKKPCILCGRPLLKESEICSFCSSPQDSEKLKKERLKKCCECGASLLLEARICHVQSCSAMQATPPFTPSSPYAYTNQGLEQSTPNDQTKPIDTQGLPSEMSLQPTDPPCMSQDELMEKIQSLEPLQPLAAPVSHSNQGKSNSMNTNLDTSVASPMNSGFLKHSSDEFFDPVKRIKTTSEAAEASGAIIVCERIDDTFGITGDSDVSPHQPVSRKRKQSDLDESQNSFVPKKLEVLDSIQEGEEDKKFKNNNNMENALQDKEKDVAAKQQGMKDDRTDGDLKNHGNNGHKKEGNKNAITAHSDESQAGADGSSQNNQSFVAKASDSGLVSSPSLSSKDKAPPSIPSTASKSTPSTSSENTHSTSSKNTPSTSLEAPKNTPSLADALPSGQSSHSDSNRNQPPTTDYIKSALQGATVEEGSSSGKPSELDRNNVNGQNSEAKDDKAGREEKSYKSGEGGKDVKDEANGGINKARSDKNKFIKNERNEFVPNM